MLLVRQELVQLRNSDIFKYSPYKALSEDQLLVVKDLFKKIALQRPHTHLISGKPGTGKTVLASYLVKYLAEHPETKHLKLGFVVPMTSLRRTIRRVFANIEGLSARQVLGPADVVKEQYDLLIVDEAHRLKRRVNIANYQSYDVVNKKLGLSKDATELDWILKSAKQHILFYDSNQTVRPSDIETGKFQSLKADRYELTSQMRVEGGEEYIHFIDDLLSLRDTSYKPTGYDFRIYDDIQKMVADVKKQDKKHGLARIVAGYAWQWKTRDKKTDFDIEIDGLRLAWNSTTADWVNSKNAINEVGCIHTVQGYDLNYAGVILGPEIFYDSQAKKIRVNPRKYMDINGRRAASPEELEHYVVNVYKTLLTRGIKGTYVYISDNELKEYFRSKLTK